MQSGYVTKLNHYNRSTSADGDVLSIAVSEQSNLLIFGSNDGITILDKNNLSSVKEIPRPKTIGFYGTYHPTSLAFYNEGKNFLCWNNHGTIDAWTLNQVHSQLFLSMIIAPAEYYFA